MRERLKSGIKVDYNVATQLFFETGKGDPFSYSSVISNYAFGLEKLIKLIILENNPVLLLKNFNHDDVIKVQKNSEKFMQELQDINYHKIISFNEAVERLFKLIDTETILQLKFKINRIKDIRNQHCHFHCNEPPETLARIAKIDTWVVTKALIESLPTGSLNLNDLVPKKDQERLKEILENPESEEQAILTDSQHKMLTRLGKVSDMKIKKRILYEGIYDGFSEEISFQCPICRKWNAFIGFDFDQSDPYYNGEVYMEFISFICPNCGIATNDKHELAILSIWKEIEDLGVFVNYDSGLGYYTCSIERVTKDNHFCDHIEIGHT